MRSIGIYSAHWYTPDYESESNKRFVADLQQNYGELTGGYAAGNVRRRSGARGRAGKDRRKTDDKQRSCAMRCAACR